MSIQQNDNKIESKWKKWLYNEFTAAVAIIGVVIGIMNWVQMPQKQNNDALTSLKSEFLLHQQLQTQYLNEISKELNTMRDGDLKDVQANIIENRNEISNLREEIVELSTIIDERIPAKK